MAEFLYFQNGAKKDSFLLVTEGGSAYLHLPSGLFSRGKLLSYAGEECASIEEKVILIFNQEHVWYPLMDRDDRAESKTLADLVETYAEEGSLPALTPAEEEIVQLLKANTGFSSEQEELFALLYAGKLHAAAWRYYPEIFKKLYPFHSSEFDFNRSHGPNFLAYRTARVAWLST